MPTEAVVQDYVRALPPIYREVLLAFPRMEPGRKAGYGLAFSSLAAEFRERQVPFTLGQIILACEELQKHGLVEIKSRIFVHPTPRGEELIEALTGQAAPLVEVDPLPPPPV